MRLVECVGFHFPELRRIVNDMEIYIVFCKHLRNRRYMKEHPIEETEEIIQKDLDRLKLTSSQQIHELLVKAYKFADVSTGCDFEEPEFIQLELLENKLYSLLSERQTTEEFLDHKLNIVAPNVHTLLGTMSSARLIAKAGNLSKLSKAPASTVQLFGAEKALFRVLKKKSNRTPKYGLLFRSSQVQNCKNFKAKGRVARALACCVARCARVDFYSQTPNTKYGETMKKLMDQRVAFYDGTLKGEMVRMADTVKELS